MYNDEKESSSTDKKHYLERYFQYAQAIIRSYTGKEPFHIYIKKYFSQQKKHGSRDRKIITSLCYNYFRLGHGVSNEISFEEKLLLSIFLCENKNSRLTESIKQEWQSTIDLPLNQKLTIVERKFDKEKIFPFSPGLSKEIDAEQFTVSFLLQPKLFIRIRPASEKTVLGKLNKAGLSFEKISSHCLAFSNNEKVSDVLEIDNEAVIQDYNSQQTLDLLKNKFDLKENITAWDCCAGSGGKAILAFDIFKNIKLTVSDKRKNILENLHTRFTKAGIKNYTFFVSDISATASSNEVNQTHNLIIADVPCSGSGTWSRTPEQISFFKESEIGSYSRLQKTIIENALPRLESNGYLLYITCSVFKKENEENVDFFQNELKLKLLEMKYLKGYQMQADTLFVALLRK